MTAEKGSTSSNMSNTIRRDSQSVHSTILGEDQTGFPPEDAKKQQVDEQEDKDLFPGPDEQERDRYLVEFSPDDPDNPKNWSRGYRWWLTVFSGVLVLNPSFASSAPSGIAADMMKFFGFGTEVATLTIALFVAGYCLGPILWGPLSEQYGRKPIFVLSFFAYTCFQLGCALSQNTASILIFRLLCGIFAASPLTNAGAVLSDIWGPDTRGKALAIFTLAPFAGPALGPLAGGYIALAGVDWRWLYWVLTIFAGVCFLAVTFALPETYAPILLVKKARRLRKETGDSRYHAPLEDRPKMTPLQHVENTVAKPFKIFFQEPMLIALTVYMSFVYGCIYLLFEAYPIVFAVGHGFSTGALGLMYLPVFAGGIWGVFLYVIYFNPRYTREMARFAPDPVPPEERLWLAVSGAPVFAIAFFWFAWTSFPSVSFWAPMMSGVFMGWGVVHIFLALFNYIIDAYLFVAASALSANTVLRSAAGAAFPLFATQMYDALGPRWASTLVGFVALIMLPIPFVLLKFGETIRMKSKHAPSPAKAVKPPLDEKEKGASQV